jgi:large subunit ribosomal protein L32
MAPAPRCPVARLAGPPGCWSAPGSLPPGTAMPHPKRRHSKHRKRIRRSHHALGSLNVSHCPRCGSASLPHRVCDNCGHYAFEKGGQRGSEVIEKDEI